MREDSLRKDVLQRSVRRSLVSVSPVFSGQKSAPSPHAAMAAAASPVVMATSAVASLLVPADEAGRKPLRSILHNTGVDSEEMVAGTPHSSPGSRKKMRYVPESFSVNQPGSNHIRSIFSEKLHF